MFLNVFPDGKKSTLFFCRDIKLIVHFHLRQIRGTVSSIQVFTLYVRNKTFPTEYLNYGYNLSHMQTTANWVVTINTNLTR